MSHRWALAPALALLLASACGGPPAAVYPPPPPGAPYVPPSYVPPSYIPPSYVPPSYVPPSYVPPSYVPPSYVPPSYIPPSYVPPPYVPPSYVPPSFVPPPYVPQPPNGIPPAGSAPPAAAAPGAAVCAAERPVIAAPAAAASGSLTDNHVHELFDLGAILSGRRFDATARLMVANDVSRATIFVSRGNEAREPGTGADDPTACYVRQALERNPGRFVPLVQPRWPSATYFASLRADLERDDTPYRGIGEITFYRPEYDGWTLSEPASAAILDPVFGVLARKGFVAYLHLRAGQDADFAAFMARFPTLKVVIHAYPSPDREKVAAWLRRFPNLTYSIDVGGLFEPSPIPYTSREAFLGAYDRQRDVALQQATAAWRGLMTELPDRVMWGTDAGEAWQYDPEVYRRAIEFSRLFVAGVAAGSRDAYTFANAARVFGAPR